MFFRIFTYDGYDAIFLRDVAGEICNSISCIRPVLTMFFLHGS